MSAFHDIWIGNTAPATKRLNACSWVANANHWYSPNAGNVQWKQEIETDTHTMIVLGQFYEKVDMAALLNDAVKYATDTSATYNDPAGHYIVFIIDKVKGNKYVFTNRFGTYHAYWSADRAVKVLTTFYLAAAKQVSDRQLDWEGITGFLAMGYFPNDKTYLNTIRIMLPASCYVFDNDCNIIKQKRYWNWENINSTVPDIYEAVKETLTDSLAFATNNKKVAMPVSGGLDSRMLVGTLGDIPFSQFKSCWAFSYGYTPDSDETRIAELVSRAQAFSFSKKVVPNYLFDKMQAIVNSVELFQYVDGTRQACMLDELSRDADVVIGGHWGDVWMDNAHLENEHASVAYNNFFHKKIIKKGSRWLLDNICATHIDNPQEYLQRYFDTEIKKYQHLEEADKIIKAFKTDQWSFRWTMPSMRMYQAATMPILPFYDKRVEELLFSIPSALLKDRQFQVCYIKKFFPKLAAIKWQEYDANLYNYKHFNNRNYLYRFGHKISRIIKGEPVTRNWELFYLNDDGKINLTHALKVPALTAIVPQKNIDALIVDFYHNPTAAGGYKISMLHTLAQFLKELHDDK